MSPKKVDQRAPDDEQPIALAQAEDAGTLPDEDRREPDAVPVAESAPPVVEAAPEPPAKPAPLAYPIN